MIVARPALHCDIDVIKSLNEIIRVAKFEAALMLMQGDIMVGSMGLIRPTWWYGNGMFLTDRWHFVLPEFSNTPAAALLMSDAVKIAQSAGLEFIHQGKIRPAKNGVPRLMPRAYPPESK
jgi:hypothetical protein